MFRIHLMNCEFIETDYNFASVFKLKSLKEMVNCTTKILYFRYSNVLFNKPGGNNIELVVVTSEISQVKSNFELLENGKIF